MQRFKSWARISVPCKLTHLTMRPHADGFYTIKLKESNNSCTCVVHFGTFFGRLLKTVTQYNTIQYNTMQYNTMQCNPMQSNARKGEERQARVRWGRIQYSTLQYSTV